MQRTAEHVLSKRVEFLLRMLPRCSAAITALFSCPGRHDVRRRRHALIGRVDRRRRGHRAGPVAVKTFMSSGDLLAPALVTNRRRNSAHTSHLAARCVYRQVGSYVRAGLVVNGW